MHDLRHGCLLFEWVDATVGIFLLLVKSD